jgi:potassium/chloride transporter 8
MPCFIVFFQITIVGVLLLAGLLLYDVGIIVIFQISIVGVLWLAGLYISSVSACMGSLYRLPKILQTIANENVIPIIRVLGHGVSSAETLLHLICSL